MIQSEIYENLKQILKRICTIRLTCDSFHTNSHKHKQLRDNNEFQTKLLFRISIKEEGESFVNFSKLQINVGKKKIGKLHFYLKPLFFSLPAKQFFVEASIFQLSPCLDFWLILSQEIHMLCFHQFVLAAVVIHLSFHF